MFRENFSINSWSFKHTSFQFLELVWEKEHWWSIWLYKSIWYQVTNRNHGRKECYKKNVSSFIIQSLIWQLKYGIVLQIQDLTLCRLSSYICWKDLYIFYIQNPFHKKWPITWTCHKQAKEWWPQAEKRYTWLDQTQPLS